MDDTSNRFNNNYDSSNFKDSTKPSYPTFTHGRNGELGEHYGKGHLVDNMVTSEQTGLGEAEKHSYKEEDRVEIESDTFLPKPTPGEDDNWTDDEEEVDWDDKKSNWVGVVVVNLQQAVVRSFGWLQSKTRGFLIPFVLLIGYFAYLVVALCYEFGSEASWRLLSFTIFGVVIAIRHIVARTVRKCFWGCYGDDELSSSHKARLKTLRFFLRWIMYGLLAGVVLWTLIDQGLQHPKNMTSVPGLFIFLFICLLFSTNPAKVNWHTIFWSFGLQFLSALLILKLDVGKDVVLWVQERLDEFFKCTEDTSRLLFGESYKDHYIVFGAFPIVFLTNATLCVLYYLGAMQFLIKVIGSFLSFVLGTSPVESMSVAAGIFLEGVTAILSLRPYLRSMSKSQLFLTITSVFASLGGAYLAILASMGISLRYLIPAMVVSAPATFAVCKLMVPETKADPKTAMAVDLGEEERSKYSNVLDAAQTGAVSMLALLGNMFAVAFAFFSYINWINTTLQWFGDRVGIEKLTIESISSYLLYPVALAMGIEPADCRATGALLGYRIGVNNLIAIFKLMELKGNKAMYFQYMAQTNGTGPVSHVDNDIVLELWNKTLENGFISERSEAIITYSLCGFSSFLSVAITLGIMFTLVPNRKVWISKVAVACLIAGNLANCMTGCFAGIFYNE